MILDSKDYAEWKNNPTTREVLRILDTVLEGLCIIIGQGSTLAKDWGVERTAMNTSYEVGKIAGITLFGNLDSLLGFEDEEKEEGKEDKGDD